MKRCVFFVIAIVVVLIITLKIFQNIILTMHIDNPYEPKNVRIIVSSLLKVALFLSILYIITIRVCVSLFRFLYT